MKRKSKSKSKSTKRIKMKSKIRIRNVRRLSLLSSLLWTYHPD